MSHEIKPLFIKDQIIMSHEKKTVAFSKNSSNLFFHILTKCNLACKYCYINPKQHGENTLNIDTIKEWLLLFAKFVQKNELFENVEPYKKNELSKKCEQINIIFLGGEPTLHPDLSLAVKEAKRLGFKSITIDTNGYLFHNILEKITPDEVDFISFSLDGATEKSNDLLRGKGCYQTVVSGIKKAVNRGFSTSMIYTVSSDNLDELSLMPELIMELGIKRFFIQVIGIRGEASIGIRGEASIGIRGEASIGIRGEASIEIRGGGLANQRQVSMESWLKTVPTVARKIAELGITVTYPKVFLEHGEKFECAGLAADNYFIFPNGRIYRCPLCEDYPLHSLQIKDNATLEINDVKSGIILTPKINETDLFNLDIPEGCVMNKLIQPGNLTYDTNGSPCYRIACCMLKEEIL